MTTSPDVYAHKALNQIPRLLGNLDRNPYSPTYGCFHRDYWLDKTSDFPDAVRQFAVHALALVYQYDFPGNIYRHQPKIREWAIAGLDYWTQIQHKDGSFDEFYPFERGWVGPSAFTCFTISEAYHLLREEIPAETRERVLAAIRRTAYFIAAGESEEDHLANHHAMACLAVWKAYRLLDEPALKAGFERLWQGFLTYHNYQEGWSREYDGVDPGYLSATVSFLGKIYQDHPNPEIFQVLRQSVEFCSYFAYPNGFYAGSLGSRNTLHFYPHGFEILAGQLPTAAAVAEKLLQGLGEGALVPPDIISDRYVVYRVPEFLQAYLDYTPRPDTLPPLPYQQSALRSFFPLSRIFVKTDPRHYTVANLAKGGVVKIFDKETGRLRLNDCGLIGQLADGRLVSSQWVDPDYHGQETEDGWEVSGYLNVIPSNKLFTPLKNIIFRSALIAFGWSPTFSHKLKGQIRKTLILGQRSVPVHFRRRLHLTEKQALLIDQLKIEGNLRFQSLSVGDEFFVRYVPQSRYFQAQELAVNGYTLNEAEMDHLNRDKEMRVIQRLALTADEAATVEVTTGKTALPDGVYDTDYYEGRLKKRQLIYRLRRRTDEVERALRTYSNGALQTIVDVGTADGLMLDDLRQRLGDVKLLGLDYSFNLLRANGRNGVGKSQGDALNLPLKGNLADAVIATAIIEHVVDPPQMIRECARILRPGGLLILTTPDPMMDWVASAVGLLKDSGHQETFDLKKLRHLCQENQFEVLEAKKFMFSPVGFPAEKSIERIFGPLGLNLVMANQLLVARRGA